MSLDITAALSDGIDRTFARNGLLVGAVFVVFGLVDAVANQTLSAAITQFLRTSLEQLPPDAAVGPGISSLPGPEQTPLALPLALPLAVGLVIALAVLAEAIRVVVVRTFVSDETETIPEELISRNLAMATVNAVVGRIVVAILVGVGLLFLVVPGVFLALSFFFMRQEIAVEDRNFVEALSASWELTSGHRLRLFLLAVALFLVGLGVSAVGVVVGLVGSPLLTSLVTTLLAALVTVYSVAVVARAYVQLRSDEPTQSEEGAVRAGDDSEWEFDPV